MNREQLGYFEEWLVETPGGKARCAGVRIWRGELPPEQAGRECGYAGVREFSVTEDVGLVRGCRSVVLRASPRRPLSVRTMLQRLEGKEIR